MILVPVKHLSNAKQRLASILSQADRTELAQTMLLDVIEALNGWQNCPGVSLVTSDPYALGLAERFHLDVIPDRANISETDAIEMATRVCGTRGIAWTLVLPADIPLVSASELDAILSQAPVEGSVLVPASDRRGTNAAFRRPAGLFPLRFGNDSFKPHLEAARATQKACLVLPLPGIALDVDNPSDLAALASASGESRSQRLIRKWNLDDQPLAVGE